MFRKSSQHPRLSSGPTSPTTYIPHGSFSSSQVQTGQRGQNEGVLGDVPGTIEGHAKAWEPTQRRKAVYGLATSLVKSYKLRATQQAIAFADLRYKNEVDQYKLLKSKLAGHMEDIEHEAIESLISYKKEYTKEWIDKLRGDGYGGGSGDEDQKDRQAQIEELYKAADAQADKIKQEKGKKKDKAEEKAGSHGYNWGIPFVHYRGWR